MSVVQVFGCLIKDTTLVIDDKYKLSVDDFPERFHKIVFGAIDHLVKNGVQTLNEIVIDDYLSRYPKQHKIFTDNVGIEYIQDAISMADTENFEYHYNTLRKISLLNQLEEKGYNTTKIYDNQIINLDESARMQARFDSYTTEDILNMFELELIELRRSFSTSSDSTSCQAGEGMKELKERLKKEPEMGMPMSSKKFTTIARGRRLKKLYLKTSPTGYGKTRFSIGDACMVSIPTVYNPSTKQWEETGCCEPTLFITTELEIDEVKTMINAYVSNVPEDKILDGKYEKDEEERVDRAIEIIEKSPLYIEYIPNFNVEDIKRVIRKFKAKKNVGYVFFDYIFSSIKILSEVAGKTRGVSMREDNVLVMFADQLKTLANTLNVHIDTSTQANGDWKDSKNADQNLIRGAKGIADKIDVGWIALPPSEKDMENIKAIMDKGFFKIPNVVYHIYKVRRGKLNHVKLWLYFDYGTCRLYDLFATDNNYKLINIDNTELNVILKQTQEDEDKKEFFY